jgi:hypothetical protein
MTPARLRNRHASPTEAIRDTCLFLEAGPTVVRAAQGLLIWVGLD